MSPVSSKDGGTEVGMETKDASPTRYLLKIDSFSLLSSNGIDQYESSEFESSGYKWKLIIYPNGDENGSGHISVYLAIVGTSSLCYGWEVNATFSFLIFDQIHDNNVLMRGMDRRFRNIKTEWGISKFISHATFKEASNGYLVNDKCVLGVDVYVIKNPTGLGEYMSLLTDVKPFKHECKISGFSKSKDEVLYSEEFTAGGYRWKINLYPSGNGEELGRSISIFLSLVDVIGFDPQRRVRAKCSVTVKDQISGAHRKMSCVQNWFAADGSGFGWGEVMAISELKDPKKGFLVGDCCIVEAEVSVLGVVNGLT